MKLRIKGNSVRLRLTKSEVEELSQTGCLIEQTSFGKNIFTYTLQSTNDTDLSADFDNGKLSVFIPESFTKPWPLNDIVGYSSETNGDISKLPAILIEKDFKCIDHTTEDQSDNFENPSAICNEQ